MRIIKGKHAITEALRSQTRIDRIVISFQRKNHPDVREILQLAHASNTKVQFYSDNEFKAKFPEENQQGIVAFFQDYPQSTDLQNILHHPKKFPFLLLLDHIQDPHNFGAILRSAEALGVHAVIYPKDRSCQITPTVEKVASGAIRHLNLIRVTNLASAVQELKKVGYWIYGADSNQGVPLNHLTPCSPLVLVVGNEGKGLSERIKQLLDEAVFIPMQGKISSLNVSVATGIILHTFAEKIPLSSDA